MLGIVILNWNGGADTQTALRSLQEAHLPPGTCIVVADNGSTDGSPDAIAKAFPEVTLLRNGANLGFAGGSNRGWKALATMGAEMILFLNNDATVAPDAISILWDTLRERPELAAVSPRIFAGAGVVDGFREVWFEKGKAQLGELSVAVHIAATDAEHLLAAYSTELVCGCALMIRTEHLRKLGGFDEALFAYYEDADLSLRLRAEGQELAVVPSSHVWHKVSSSTGGAFSPTSVFYCARNARRVARKHGTPEQWQQFDRMYLRAIVAQSRYFTRGGSSFGAEAGGAALMGGYYGWKNQTGIRPLASPAPFVAIAKLLAKLP